MQILLGSHSWWGIGKVAIANRLRKKLDCRRGIEVVIEIVEAIEPLTRLVKNSGVDFRTVI